MNGPFIDLFPASQDPAIVSVVRERFLQAYNTARSINAKDLIFHAGYVPKAYFPEQWLKTSIKFWKEFLLFIGDEIEIHIENVCEDDYRLINDLVEAIDSDIFSVCLDIGHANINSKLSIEEWIKGLNSKIKYVHLHNNDGKSDGHGGLCKGTINMYQVLEQLGKYAPNAKWSLETKLNETEESILFLNSKGFFYK